MTSVASSLAELGVFLVQLDGVLPDDFQLPSVEYLVLLVTGVVAVVGALLYLKPNVDEGIVVGFGPWIVVGATLRVIHRMELLPEVLQPFFGTPAVYVSVFIAAGVTWVVAEMLGTQTDVIVSLNGSIVAVMLIASTLFFAARDDSRTLDLELPLLAFLLAVVIAGVAWYALGVLKSKTIVRTGGVGGMVIFGHTLDGISTAVGVDYLGAEELTPISRAVIEFGADLPTADTILGTAWIFVVVKVVLAVAIVWFFTDFVNDRPSQGFILLGAIAAVGLGPGIHNILLFIIGGA